MKHRAPVLALGAALAALLTPTLTAADFTLDGRKFTVPAGFIVERVATTNLVQRPVSGSIDDRGRLYVTDSSGSNLPPAEQLKNPTHRVLRLEDTNGDGVFDKSVVFADKVMFPQGCLWHAGSVYVAGPPSIWKFTDTDGDGVADKREDWFNGGTLTGCANDIHGPYLGPDGFLYWTKGAFSEQTHTLGDGSVLKDRAAHIFRRRPDGTGMGVVMTGGMDNPVEVAFSREGEVFFTSTFIDFSQPGFRDGIGHATYGAVFGKEHDVINDRAVKRTGPKLTQPFIQFGAGAPSGLCRYESDVFGAGYKDNLFASLFNLHKITRHELRPNGATYASTDSDFLVSDDVDFHPTDVLEDGDGSLLVIDTGGWYKLCCPSSQLAKPDVFGAIYRVRKANAKKVNDPHGLQTKFGELKPEELAKLLGDPRPMVRSKAADELVKLGDAAIPAISIAATNSTDIDFLCRSAFALGRVGTSNSAVAVTHTFLADYISKKTKRQTTSPQQAALRSLILNPIPGGPFTLRSPLTSLLLLGHSSLYPPAIELAVRTGDTDLAYPLFVLRRAIETPTESAFRGLSLVGRANEIREAIYIDLDPDPLPYPRPASVLSNVVFTLKEPRDIAFALGALEAVANSDIRPDEVAPSLTSTNQTLRETAQWIVGRHPEWSGELAGWFRQQLSSSNMTVISQLGILTKSDAGQQLLAEAVTNSVFGAETRVAALNAIAGAGLKTPPAVWRDAVRTALGAPSIRSAGPSANPQAEQMLGAPLLAAVKAARAFSTDGAIQQSLHTIAADTRFPGSLRLEALGSLPPGAALDDAGIGFLKANLASTNAPLIRTAAASALAKAKLTDAQRLELASLAGGVGPLELPRLLAAFEPSPTEALGLKLLSSLKDSAAAKSLPVSVWKGLFARYPASVRQASEPFVAGLDADAPKQAARLEALLAEIAALPRDVRRGQAVFNSAKAACAACHRIGYLGGKLGPDLTSIAPARTERDLLEAIVFPSASFVRSYEPVVILRRDGEEIAGVLRRDGAAEVVIATGPETEVAVARGEITEMLPGKVSAMPQGLDGQLTTQELADLVAFLKGTKRGAN